MMRKMALVMAIMAVVLLSATVLWAQSPVGKWKPVNEKTGKSSTIVSIYEQNGLIYGKIIEMLNPAEKNNICDKCEGEDKGKPILGLVIIKNLKADDDEYSGGTILDPGSGKVYKSKLKVIEGGKTMKVSGCILFICRAQTWLKMD